MSVVAVVGSRSVEFLPPAVEKFLISLNPSKIVSGGAKGVDSLAVQFAVFHGIPFVEFKPDWNRFGRRAGALRNAQIVEACDIVVAVLHGESRGTQITINLANSAGKPCHVFRVGQPSLF